MNKDFWERIDKLEELAGKAMQGRWAYGLEAEKLGATYPDSNRVYANLHGYDEPAGILVTVNHNLKLSDPTAEYIAAANPAMILEMIAELKILDDENYNLKGELRLANENAYNMEQDYKKLEKEADMLASFCADLCPNVPYHVNCQSSDKCPGGIDCKNSDKPEEWRKLAKKMLEETNG